MSITQVSDAMRVTTSLDATKLTGNLPAISGASLTGVVGTIVQVVNVQSGALVTGTTILPFDDTIPQNTEGVEVMTLAITPTNASNKLKIEVVTHNTHSIGSPHHEGVALFQDSIAGALATGKQSGGSGFGMEYSFNHYMAAGTTSATTFKVRIGSSGAGTMTFNGSDGARQYGGVMASSITITEIAV